MQRARACLFHRAPRVTKFGRGPHDAAAEGLSSHPVRRGDLPGADRRPGTDLTGAASISARAGCRWSPPNRARSGRRSNAICSLPHGPRPVAGKIVRVTAAPGGFELAIAFGELKPAAAAAIANLIAERTKQVMPAKLRINGVEQTAPLRGARRRAGRPADRDAAFLAARRRRRRRARRAGCGRRRRNDPQDRRRSRRPPTASRGWRSTSRSTTSRAPGPSDTAPRSRRLRATPPPVRLPPTRLPPPCGHPLPSVVVAAGLTRDVRLVEARPPRRRVHGTAEIVRRPDLAAWAFRPAMVMAVPRPGGRDDRHRAAGRAGHAGLVVARVVGGAGGPRGGRPAGRYRALRPLGRLARSAPHWRHEPANGSAGRDQLRASRPLFVSRTASSAWPRAWSASGSGRRRGSPSAWEIVEHVLKNLVPSLFAYPSQDTLVNSIGDVVSTLLGWAVATAVRQRRELRGLG